jgi:membrane protease YdiL (CAAX protease family)
MRRLILIVLATELALLIASRVIVPYWTSLEWQAEALRSVFRLGAALVFWYFFRTTMISPAAEPAKIRHPLCMAAICLFLAVPLLVGDWRSMGSLTKIVFAMTSIVVAMHEEFLFRGIVQNVLASRFGIFAAIVLTSVIATIWHLGALPLNVFNFLQVFVASCLLGLIYAKTRSILVVVSLHALYDAAWSLTPVLRVPLSWQWGAGALVLALILTSLWARREPWPNPVVQKDA